MADEFLGTVSAKLKDGKLNALLSKLDFHTSPAALKSVLLEHNVGITEEAMKLGELAALGWCLIVNYDTTNYVSVLGSTGGTNILRVPPASACLFHFGTGVTAPYLIANVAPCDVGYLICDR